jgi:hypothetical protein
MIINLFISIFIYEIENFIFYKLDIYLLIY